MELARDDVGTGSAVVLLHAGVADRTMWNEHLEPIAAAGYRALAFDLPGFGDTPPTSEAAPWADVLQTMGALGIERAALVGNSFGGSVALSIAACAPDRVSALMLVSAVPLDLEPSSRLNAAWDAESAALERGDVAAAVDAVVEAWTLPDATPALRERVASMQRRAFERQLAAGPASEVPDPAERDRASLAELAVPILVVAGELDMPDFLRRLRGARRRAGGGASRRDRGCRAPRAARAAGRVPHTAARVPGALSRRRRGPLPHSSVSELDRLR